MPSSKYDVNNVPRLVAEGRADTTLRDRAAYKTQDPGYPVFVRFIILEVISDPQTIDSVKLSHYENDLMVGNINYASVAPRNSIIARRAKGVDSGDADKVMVLYPFFPSHIQMPCKPGEHVWGMFENPDAKTNELGYWMCKIATPSFVDDVNYTHSDRQFDASFTPGLSDVFEGTDDAKYEFHNGAVDKDASSGDRYVAASTTSLPGGDDTAYQQLLTETDAAKQTVYEPVPRVRKRPSDLVFEGSNNSSIVLGTDRTGPVAAYTVDPNLGQVPGPVTKDIVGQGQGSIDLTAGRGQTTVTGGTPQDNKIIGKEIGKSKKDLAVAEGDVDFINDRSRVLISQKTKPDTNFSIANIVSAHASAQPPIIDADGEGAIVIKTDKLRLIARHDVTILVTGAIAKDANGNVQDPGTNAAVIDPTLCASIIIRVNGDIIFTPAAKGVIKMGGDDASLAVLCQVATTGNDDNSGTVTANPIIDTMFGSQGLGGASGQYARKVLMK